MTEEEAKTKWCPMARILFTTPDGGYAVGNLFKHSTGMMEATMCLGSGCMLWREHPDPQMGGYCGLAGVPFVPERGRP